MFTAQDLFVISILVFLEAILSIDNALVLAILARGLPKELQKKALTYGLVGAVIFRLIALSLVTYLIHWTWVKYVGGAYLVFIALKHFLKGEEREHSPKANRTSFWKVVLVIELTDIAFALDSILAAVALSQKFWVIFAGGLIGVILMRFAASGFIKLLTRFPGFETTAYSLVFLIGIKVVLEATRIEIFDFHSTRSPAFWIFWILMILFIGLGFFLKPKKNASSSHSHPEVKD